MTTRKHNLSSRDRGSIMLFVVVLLVLMALIGTAYIQQARYDRIASLAGVKNNIGRVADSTVAYISEVLRNDLLSDDGSTMFDGTSDEPYDYPWTNSAETYPVEYFDGTMATGNATGGKLDDTWLASSEPDFTASPVSWPHITDLNGFYLRLPKSGSGKTLPDERVMDYTATDPIIWQLDKNVPFNGASDQTYLDNNDSGNYDTLGADADNDGIYDSKWTWAPIRQISGVSYVMAVRIIDNSAMINANTAMGQVTALETFDITPNGTNAPRWMFPSELDFSNFYYNTASPATTTPLQNFFKTRFGGTDPGSTLIGWFGTTHTRYDFWESAARLWNNYGSGYASWTINDELELRHSNGLNDSTNTTSIESTSSSIGSFLRQSNSETTYTDWTGSPTIQNFFQSEPRHQMTTRSGAAVYAMRLMDATADVTFNGTTYTQADFNDPKFPLKKNINTLSKDELALEVFKVLVRGAFKGLNATEVQTYTNQFVANFEDHTDADNWISTYHGQNGIEEWPAITEVYTQRPVQITTGGITAGSQSNFWNVTGSPTGSSQTGYAIELINPHTKPIPISDIYVDLTYTDTGGNPQTVQLAAGSTLESLISTAVKEANHGDEWLYPGQKVVIYHDSAGGSTASYTSDYLRDRDSIVDYVFDNSSYSPWSASHGTYNAGEVVYQQTSGGEYALYECILGHTSNASKKPSDGTTYATGHDYWRRKVIAVDGGAWPIPDSGYDATQLVSVKLSPATQASGDLGTPASAGFPYQSVSVLGWNSSQSISETDVAYNVANWVNGTTYNPGDTARSAVDFQVYHWINITSGVSNTDPSSDSTNWALSTGDNLFYVQANAIGSVDGLEAFAFKDGDFVRNRSDTMSPILPHQQYFSQIVKPDKSTAPSTTWTAGTAYVAGNTVVDGSEYYLCIKNHTSQAARTDDADKWVLITNVGDSDPASGIRGISDQFLLTDSRATHQYWEDGRSFVVGDVVRGLNSEKTYVCIQAHTADISVTKPGVGSSWGSYWAEHWRSANNGYPVANIAELMQIVVAGPNSSLTLPDILGDSTLLPTGTHLDSLMMPLDTTVVADSGSMAVPHALALMQRLTIHEPENDNLDNDGDSVLDNAAELLVPGTVNINTAPAHLLNTILPIPDSTLRSNVVNAIANYRDGNGRLAHWRTNPGFASTAELYRALQAGSNTRLDASPYAADIASLNSTLVDFENPDPITNDGVADDREEALLLARDLMGVCSARSDVYTAYVLIRGYPSGDFTKGAVESKRLIAVFDRSNITSSDSTPKILGVYDY